MIRVNVLLCPLLLFSALCLSVPTTNAAVHSRTETFNTTQYRDALNTTAWWDTASGELKLYPFTVTLKGTYDSPGSASGVALHGDYAFLADYTSGLRVVDISDPESPSFVTNYNLNPAYGVAISGDHAFVPASTYGLYSFDISDPTSLVYLSRYDTPAYAQGVAISGNFAYVADGTSLQVVNITNPAAIGLAGSVSLTSAFRLDVEGNYAYVAGTFAGLYVVDITNPSAPVSAALYATPGSAYDVVVDGNYAYIADTSGGLLVLDVSDPTNPAYAGVYDTPGSAYGVDVTGDYAYIADLSGGLVVLDVSDPTNPMLVETAGSMAGANQVSVAGEYAFVSSGSVGLQVARVAAPISTLGAAGVSGPLGEPRGIVISGNYAFVAARNATFKVVDISDPTNLLGGGGYVSLPYGAEGIDIDGDHAYVLDLAGLRVINVEVPTSPTIVGEYLTNSGDDVVVDGDHAYVIGTSVGLEVVDISDPTTPAYAGSVSIPNGQSIAVSGDHAYVANLSGADNLYVVDISNPATPVIITTFTADASGYGSVVVVDGDYLLFGSSSKVSVLDITSPASPVLLGYCYVPYVEDIAVAGNHLFAASGNGLYVVDITDPTTPALYATYVGYGRNLAISGSYAYVGDLQVLSAVRVFSRHFEPELKRGQSIVLDSTGDRIVKARLTTSQVDFVEWEISADNGANWQPIVPDGNWNAVASPGSEILWRSSHYSLAGTVNPGCSQLNLEWLYEAAIIDSIVDIGNDQGRQVRVSWTRNAYDIVGSSPQVTEYAVFRRVDGPPGGWEFVTTVPADAEERYAVVVPTLADSTVIDGMHYSAFFVRAGTATPAVYYDSRPDSGYSVDNLAPGTPSGLVVLYEEQTGNSLSWDECPDEDFLKFQIYRGETVDFAPSPELLVHTTVSAAWVDPVEHGWRYYYTVTAVDRSGNESATSAQEPVTGVGATRSAGGYALYQNVPNPCNPTTTVIFEVPVATQVRLSIYNVRGERIRVLLDETVDPGSRQVIWDGRDSRGRSVSSGIYFYRLETPEFERSRKLVLVQ